MLQETKQKISLARKNKHKRLGYLNSPETRKRMSLSALGKVITPETRKKISDKLKGRVPKNTLSWFGENHPRWKGGRKKQEIKCQNCGEVRIIFPDRYQVLPKYCKKCRKISITGDKCHMWKGGISYVKYTTDWTNTLKRAVRERDNYTCRICNSNPSITVHHIDYNKKNCELNNLITVCRSCHAKTNQNREWWHQNLLQAIEAKEKESIEAEKKADTPAKTKK